MNDSDHCTHPTLWWCPLTHDYACKECNRGFKVTPVKTDKEIIADLQKKIDELEKLVEKKDAAPYNCWPNWDTIYNPVIFGDSSGSLPAQSHPNN